MRQEMMRKALVAAVLGIMLGAPPTRADITTIFDASGTFSDGSTLSGTVTIDVTSGTATSWDLTAGSYQFLSLDSQQNAGGAILLSGDDSSIAQLSLFIPVAGLAGYTGGSLTTSSNLQLLPSFDQTQLTSGSLTSVPEPSTLAIGAIGAVAFLAYGWSRQSRHPRKQRQTDRDREALGLHRRP